MKRRRFLSGLGVLPVFFTRPLFAKAEDQKKLSRERLTEPLLRVEKDNEAQKVAEETPLPSEIENHLGYYRLQSRAGRALTELGGFTVTEQSECRKAICKRLPDATKDFKKKFIDHYREQHCIYMFDAVTDGTTLWNAIFLTYRGLYKREWDDSKELDNFVWVDGFDFFGVDLEREFIKAKFPIGTLVAVDNDKLPKNRGSLRLSSFRHFQPR